MSSAKFIILGDMKQGTEALPTAVHFLKQARKDGNQSLNKTFYFGEIKIRVVLDPYAGDKVYIEPPDCGNVAVSGFLDTFRVVDTSTPRYLVDAQLLKEHRHSVSPKARVMYGVRPVNPNAKLVAGTEGVGAPSDVVGVDGNLYIRSDTDQLYRKESGVWYEIVQPVTGLKLTTQLPVEATLLKTLEDGSSQLTVAKSLFRETFERLLPSKFAGFMRQVMQVTFATDYWRGFASVGQNPAVLPVNYKYGDSWGCIKHGGRFFVIQITLDAVYSVPADICVRAIKDAVGTKRGAVTLRSVNTAKKVKIGTIPAGYGSSWDVETGWAFGYSSAEAAIVLHKENGDGKVETRLAIITFSFDTQTSELVGAVPSISDPTIIWAPVDMTGKYSTSRSMLNIATDLGEEQGGLQNVTFNFGIRSSAETYPGYSVDAAPIYVYYTEAGGRRLSTYSYREYPAETDVVAEAAQTTGTDARGFTIPNDKPRIDQPWFGTRSKGAFVVYGFDNPQGSASENSSYTEWTYSSPLPNKALDESAYYVDASAQLWVTTYPDGVPTEAYVGPWSERLYGEIGLNCIGRNSKTVGGGAVTTRTVLTIPVYDREAVLMYTVRSTSQKTTINNEAAWVYNNYDVRGALAGYYNGNSDGVSDVIVAMRLAEGPPGTYPCGSLSYRHYAEWRSTATGGLFAWLGQATSITINPDNVVWNYLVGPNGCGYTAYTRTVTSTVVDLPPVRADTVIEPATSETSMVLHIGGGQISVAAANASYIEQIHPASALKYVVSSAAFDPQYFVRNETVVPSKPIVRFGSTTYPIENQLFGWIGVV